MATKKQTASAKKRSTRSTKQTTQSQELDGVFFLKLVFYLILGSLWLKATDGTSISIGIPVGLIIGLAFAFHEHFQIDKKIEFAVLLVATLVGFVAPFGLYVMF